MTFQPVVPFGGHAGWAFLQRTETAQRDAFERSPSIERETTHFTKNIGKIKTAEALVADHSLMKVALGAFGLEDDIQNKAFIQKILEGGIVDPDSLANRLSDRRYFEMAKAFGFDLGTPSTQLSTFADEIIEKYNDRKFEVAVGNQSEEMRLALGLDRDLTEIATSQGSEEAKWFQIMGTPPLRAVFETAFGLPASFGSIPLDQQLDVFMSRAEAAFGSDSISQFAETDNQDALLNRFFALGQLGQFQSSQTSSSSSALALLQASLVAPLT